MGEIMNIAKQQKTSFVRHALALAVLAAFGQAQADDSNAIVQLAQPESSYSIGLGAVSGDSRDRAQFGMYNGMRNDDFYGLLDFSLVKRDDATGTWTILEGSNLGLDSRELGFTQQRQGDWKVSVNYSGLVRNNPYTINTGMQGAGTTTPTVVRLATPGTGTDVNLDIKRQRVGMNMEKWITPSLQFEASFKNEDKDGARLFGKGFACSGTWVTAGACASSTTQWAILMLPEPINTSTRQLEAKLNFSGEKLNLSGGYYGSFFTNSNGALTPGIPSNLNNPLGASTALDAGLRNTLGLPMALQPDNQAHQFYLSGNYTFTPTTRATFKYAYTHATQNQDFASAGLTGAPAGVGSLNGELNTSLAQVGLTSRPIPKLTLNANLRYEDKKDNTPIALYNVEGPTSNPANFFTNSPNSLKKLVGKVEGSYRLPDNYRATVGVDYTSMDRSLPIATTDVAGLSALRGKTEETGYRLELRRAMSDTLNGAIGYSSSKRTGSDWYSLSTSGACGTFGACYGSQVPDTSIVSVSANSIFPAMLADRERDKWKLSADWNPTERLSLQFIVEDGTDKNTSAGGKGWRDTGVTLYSVDASFALNDKWKLTGYASHGDQTLHVNHSTGYRADLNNVNDTVGIGVNGKTSEKLTLGANLGYSNDVNHYNQTLDPAASATNVAFLNSSGGLPDVTFRQTTLNLFGKYALDKVSAVRVNLIHQRNRLDEWTWNNNGVPFLYSDNTTVSQNPKQNVTFLGVSYSKTWR